MRATYDLFLSYNSKDRDAVRQVCEALKARGIKPWIDFECLTPGRLWQEEAEEGLRSCRAAAVFVGPKGIGPWENIEMRALLSRVAQEGLPLIPVPLPGAPDKLKLPTFLAELTWVDLRKGITDASIDHLVQAIPKKTKKKSGKPPPANPSPPTLHNLPFPPLGDLMSGRDDELRKLAESLEGDSKPTAILQSRALYGLGGIGKTRLAVEHAWRHGSRYRAVFFVVADSPDKLYAGLAALARVDLLDLPERDAQAQEETVFAVLRWLKANPGWLLILDNVDSSEAEKPVLALLPSLQSGQVLITSRLREWPPAIQRQPLDTISLEEARDFLFKRTEENRRHAPDEAAHAKRLAEKLDGLPLALEQAGAYISRLRMSFAEYLEAWETERERVLGWYDEAVMGYPASVAVTWQKSFDRLTPTAAAILRLTAFLAPDPIPEEMFESWKETVHETVELLCNETGQEEDGGSIREALAELESYSLISRQDAKLTVHRVVQEVLRSRIPSERQRDWIESSLRLVNGYSPFEAADVLTWPVWNNLRAHAAKIVDLAAEAGVANPTGRLMNQLGLYLWARSLYLEAEPLMQRALDIDERTFGNYHPAVAVRLNNLALLLRDTNRLAEAEPLMRRALAIDEQTSGKEHPSVARDLINLATLLKDTNRFDEAEPLMRMALAIDEKAFGNDHPEVAIDLNNLAQLLHATKRLDEAEPMMRRVLAIDEKAVGNEHPNVARDLNNLALLLQDTKRLDEAEPMMQRSVEIKLRSLGPDHSSTQLGQRNLAALLAAMAEKSDPPPEEEL